MGKEIIEYNYLNSKLAKERENNLEKYMKYGSIIDFNFFDLTVYKKQFSLKDKILNTFYNSKIDNKKILTNSQIEILNILFSKENLFLSAPTSFGKTFIILEYIKRNNKLDNIVFIVPTLSLMNEILKKIYNSFSDEYNICINADENFVKKNIFIFVPERSDNKFVEKIKEIGLDLLIIDEIYKLSDRSKISSDDRLILMNRVYMDLTKIAKQMIFLGPFIKNILFERSDFNLVKYYTNLSLVFNEIIDITTSDWTQYISSNDKQLIFFRTPGNIYKYIEKILKIININPLVEEKYSEEIKYLSDNVNENWYAIELLRRGIGIHHGKIPMYLRKFYETEYSNKDSGINVLLCTSTMMEGINTPTLNLIVVDNPNEKKSHNCFKLNNLIGRVGRLNPIDPKIGKIYIASNECLSLLNDKEKWETIKIIAEDNKGNNPDEIIQLKKNENNFKKKDKEKLIILKDKYGITLSNLARYNIKLNSVIKIIENDIIEKFYKITNQYEGVKFATSIINPPRDAFLVEKFDGLKYKNKLLPFNVYINNLLNKKNYSEIIKNFNKEININRNIKNINIFIDSLMRLDTYIKFKLITLIDYFELFKVDISKNIHLRKFINNISSYKNFELKHKILEDLGIESIDYNIITKLVGNLEGISTSKMIKLLRENKNKILHYSKSPFTKKNIGNM